MERTPLVLAALASAAVPGLDPVTVESLPSDPGERFDSAIVRDTEHRHWVVRAPRSEAAAAALDSVVPLLGLLARRLSVSVPAPKGFVTLKEGGRASVHPLLPGHALDFAHLPPGPGLASELGKAIAAIHNLDPALYEESGLPAYDAEGFRARRLSDLDRAASTGRVPIGLLSRWEQALENVSLWKFATTPTHGSLTGDHVLAVFDGEDATTGRIRGVLSWEDAEVADPALDFARLVADSEADAVESVLEAYAHARVERPDPNLLVRARLLGELSLLRDLGDALSRRDEAAVHGVSGELRRLDDRMHSLEESSDDYRRMSLSPVGLRSRGESVPGVRRGTAAAAADVIRSSGSQDAEGPHGSQVTEGAQASAAEEADATSPARDTSTPSRADETAPIPVAGESTHSSTDPALQRSSRRGTRHGTDSSMMGTGAESTAPGGNGAAGESDDSGASGAGEVWMTRAERLRRSGRRS